MISSKRLNFWFKFLLPINNIMAAKDHPVANFKIDEKDGCVILSNHETTDDQHYITKITKQKIYWLTASDLIQNRFWGKVLMYLARPIIKDKGNKTDLRPIKECIQLCKENQIVGIFPEGNKTMSGEPCYIDKSIAKLVKLMNKPVYIVNIDGYNNEPRWSDHIRNGHVEIRLRKKISVDELSSLDLDELYEVIKDNLKVERANIKGWHKKQAERFERLAFICPVCHHVHTIITKGEYVYCTNCNLKVKINDLNELESDNPKFKFKTIPDWYNFQINELKQSIFNDDPIYIDENVSYEEPRNFKKLIRYGKGDLKLYKDRFVFTTHKNKEYIVYFDQIDDVCMVVKSKLQIHAKDKTIVYHGNRSFNSLKYMLTYYIIQYKNGKNPDLFLGI